MISSVWNANLDQNAQKDEGLFKDDYFTDLVTEGGVGGVVGHCVASGGSCEVNQSEPTFRLREGGRGGREGGREGGRREKEGERRKEREGGRKGGRKGGREGGREEREGRRGRE